MNYEVRMEGVAERFEAANAEEATEHAEQWIRDGNWDTTEGTVWVHGFLFELDAAGERTEEYGTRVEVTIQPAEPACTEDEHDWQSPIEIVGGIKENPGVWGHGGGVVIHEACMNCGCERLTDTWAQDPDTGRQGLRSVRYEPGKYTAKIEALREDEQ